MRLFGTGAGEPSPAIPSSGTKPRYLHLSGRASAAAIEDTTRIDLMKAYIRAAVASGDPGHGFQIRYSDGSCVTVELSDAADPVLPPVPPIDSSATVPFPANLQDQLLRFRGRMMRHHQQLVGAVQSVLDPLVGKRGQTIKENRAVVAAVNAIANDYGVALLYDRQAVALRVIPLKGDEAGSFQVRLLGSSQKVLKTSMAFPPLTAVSRAALIEYLAAALGAGDTEADDAPANAE